MLATTAFPARAFLLFLLSPGQISSANDTPTNIAAYYYPWYVPSHRWDQGYLREKLDPPHKPFLGEYNMQDPAIADQHAQWANHYGISQFICSWWGPQSDTDSVLLHNLLQSSSLRNLKVALLYESQGLIARLDDNKTIPFDDHSAEKLKQHVGYMAEQYFHHPNYLKVDGKPVIYFYLSRVFSGIYKEAFANMRLVLRQKYGYELYLVGDEVYWGGVPDLQRIQTWDAITSYNMHGIARHAGYPGDTNYLQDVQQRFTEFQSTTDSLGLDFVPQIAPAFNDRGVRLQANHYAIPHEMRAELAGSGQFTTFWESLNMAQRVLKQSNRTTSNTIVVTSWNEWHEDSSIEPTAVGAPSTNKPNLYTENYTYEAFGFKLLEMVQRFHNQSLRQENFKSKELSDSTTLLEN